MPNFKVKSSTIILLDIPRGKPNPINPQQRISQAPQKGNTCFYYATNIIRKRKGELPFDATYRAHEKNLSGHRTEATKYAQMHSAENNFLHSLQIFYPIKAGNKQAYLDNGNKLISQAKEKEEIPIAKNLLEKFSTQNKFDDLILFAKYKQLKEKIKIKKDFFKKYDLKVELPFSKNQLNERHIALDGLFILKSIELYNLSFSDWHPKKEHFKELFKALETKGPLMVWGQFGKKNHTSKPFELKEKLAGETIYGWQPNSYKSADENHVIVVIGARQDSDKHKAYIYYLDPADGSDVTNGRPIYVMSYENFCNRIANFGYPVSKDLFAVYRP